MDIDGFMLLHFDIFWSSNLILQLVKAWKLNESWGFLRSVTWKIWKAKSKRFTHAPDGEGCSEKIASSNKDSAVGGYENLEIPWNPIKSQLLRCNLMWIVFWWSSSVVLDYNFEWQMIPMTWDNPTNPSDSSGFQSQLSERDSKRHWRWSHLPFHLDHSAKNLLCIGVVIHHGSWWKAKKRNMSGKSGKIAGDDLTWCVPAGVTRGNRTYSIRGFSQ